MLSVTMRRGLNKEAVCHTEAESRTQGIKAIYNTLLPGIPLKLNYKTIDYLRCPGFDTVIGHNLQIAPTGTA